MTIKYFQTKFKCSKGASKPITAAGTLLLVIMVVALIAVASSGMIDTLTGDIVSASQNAPNP